MTPKKRFYELLGRITWSVGKRYVKRKMRRTGSRLHIVREGA
jgi:hypothetical protein